jgi:hypothetical protein
MAHCPFSVFVLPSGAYSLGGMTRPRRRRPSFLLTLSGNGILGGDAAVVGRTLKLDGAMHEIIGILPAEFVFMDRSDVDVVVPRQIDRTKTTLGSFSANGLARLKPGVTLQQATADLTRLVPIATHNFPPPKDFSIALFEQANFTPTL